MKGKPVGAEPVDDSRCWADTDNDNKLDEIACSDERGVWDPENKCYLRRVDPQPPKGDPAWKGHDDGVVYLCVHPWNFDDSPDGTSTMEFIWRPEPVEQDPEVLARRAVDSMNLEAIEIGLPVSDDDESMIYVGAPVWLWVSNPGPRTTGPNQASAGAGGVTVTVRARLAGITWDLGEGTKVRCNGTHRAKGTVYKPAFGLRDSPTCGYRYQHPHERVEIRATSRWQVEWEGGGQDGTLTFELTRTATRRVGEIQVLVGR